MEYTLDTSLAPETWRKLDPFTQGYISTAMWLLTDEDGESLDYLGLHDVAPETIDQAIEDCKAFQLDEAGILTKYDTFRAGHDFWLTRNRHGAGFWDGDYEEDDEDGRTLTESAHAYGEVDWYVGDDGMIYQM